MKFIYVTGIFIICIAAMGCKGKGKNNTFKESPDSANISIEEIHQYKDTLIKAENEKEEIYGDTVWTYPYGNQVWHDTLAGKDFNVFVSTWVDTTDYLVDTVRSAKGNRIVIGYNHYYTLNFSKNEKPWFFVNFNKKDNLYPLIYGSDLWLESNLNVVNNIIYNEKFRSFIIELSFNSRDEFNSMFYLVTDLEGIIHYLGTISSWGGGGTDGIPFLTDDGRMYVTSNEIYNFVTGTAVSLGEYASLSQLMSGKNNTAEYIQIHGLRYLSYNNFLVVFNRFHNKPKFNALILNTDSLVVNQFGYYSQVEDIDAVLLFEESEDRKTAYLYDTEREILISIKKEAVPVIRETRLYEMTEVEKYKTIPLGFQAINFGFYGSCEFYVSNSDSVIYYCKEKIH